MAGKKRIRELVPANQSKDYKVFKSVSHDILLELVEVGGLLPTTTYTSVKRGW
jgi:hypothetical protein